MSQKSVLEIIKVLDGCAPADTAEDWDQVGLLVGDPSWKTSGAIVSIDLTAEAIEQAKTKKFRLIVNHHPAIFPKSRGLGRVTASSKGGVASLVFEAIREGIAVAAYHTNFDRCSLEVVREVSRGLGLEPKGRLFDHHTEHMLLKLVVFVPESHVERVRNAICDAGAGHVGNYDFCTFGSKGEGTFRGGEMTKPFLGKPGRLEKTHEIRLETVFPRGFKQGVLAALREAHPYEEIAFDLVPVEQSPSDVGIVRGLGYGFWGDFTSSKPLSKLTKDVKELFHMSGFLLTDPSPKSVKRIAFVAGKGASFVNAAINQGCDLLITGEIGYHGVLESGRKGMSIMEIGHRESERFFLSTIANWLSSSPLMLKTKTINRPSQKFWGSTSANCITMNESNL